MVFQHPIAYKNIIQAHQLILIVTLDGQLQQTSHGSMLLTTHVEHSVAATQSQE